MTDGVFEMIGTAADYAYLKARMEDRQAVPTDISIKMSADEVSAQKYNVVAEVTLDPDSEPRTVRVHLVNSLYDYPASSDERYAYCAMFGAQQDVALEPGVPALVEYAFTFSSASWSAQDDIAIVAFVQKATTAKEISNAELMKWPFPPTDLPEDINGDGVVDVLDLIVLLAAWGTADPAADVNGDGIVNVLDLILVLSAWS